MKIKLKILLSLLLLYFLTAPVVSKAYAGACNASSTNMCSTAQLQSTPSSHDEAICFMLKQNDTACRLEMYTASFYTATATMCWVSVATGEVWASTSCSMMGFTAAAMDMIASTKVQTKIHQSDSLIAKNWGYLLGAAGDSGTLVASIVNGFATANAASLAPNASAATQANALEKQNLSSLATAILATAMATGKWADFMVIQQSSQKNLGKLKSISNAGKEKNSSSGTASNNQGSSAQTGSSGTGSNNASNSTGSAAGSGNTEFNPNAPIDTEINSNLNDSAISAALRNDELYKKVGTATPSEILQALNSLKSNTGLSIGKLTEAARKDGLERTIGSILENYNARPETLSEFRRLSRQLALDIKNTPRNTNFTSTLASQSSQTSQQAFHPSIVDQTPQLADSNHEVFKPKSLLDRDDEKRIFHSSVDKSIFEIVSERTSSISVRIGASKK